jgi:hypothetical protein
LSTTSTPIGLLPLTFAFILNLLIEILIFL